MVDRIDQWMFSRPRSCAVRRGFFFFFLLAFLGAFSVSSAETPVYVPRAHIARVDRAFMGQGSTPMPGAGVRAFQDPGTAQSGTERFEIHWYANPPGIPPGGLLLLESLQERNGTVKNHVLRMPGKSEGNILSIIEIPSDEVRQSGRIVQWRVRVVWRGRLLASQASDNWEG